tara:strand:+ start:537 stop:971 length:435 start_codon:yes stop_codon:yes gene_type:complete
MRIYIENTINIKNLLNSKDIYITSANKSYIYTIEGIYTIINNNIYKFNIHDGTYEYLENFIKNIPIYVDYTNITIINKPVNFIPHPNYSHEFKEYTVKITKDSIVSLIIRISNNTVIDWFFVSNETLDNQFVKIDINKLISYIN